MAPDFFTGRNLKRKLDMLGKTLLLALCAAAAEAFQPGKGLPLRGRQELRARACARCWIRAVRLCVSV